MVAFEHDLNLLGAAIGAVEGVGAGSPNNGAALAGQAAHLSAGQVHEIPFDDATPAVAEPHELVTVVLNAFEHGAADNSVKAGAVAAGGEQTDFHDGSLGWRPQVLGLGARSYNDGLRKACATR